MQTTPKLQAEASIHLDKIVPSTDLIQGVFPSTLIEPDAAYPIIDSADNWSQIYSYLGYVNHSRHKYPARLRS